MKEVRTTPAFEGSPGHLCFLYVTSGVAQIGRTRTGNAFTLAAGDLALIDAGTEVTFAPVMSTHTWAVYVDKRFHDQAIEWLLPLSAQGPTRLGRSGECVQRVNLRVLRSLPREVEHVMSLMKTTDHRSRAQFGNVRRITLYLRMLDLLVSNLQSRDYSDKTTDANVRLRAGASDPVATAIALLQRNIRRHWTIEDLSAAVSLSRSQLTRLFKARLGTPPYRYLTQLRVKEFARLLAETTLPVAEAARHVGWNNHGAAASWFREAYGLTPSTFRNRIRFPFGFTEPVTEPRPWL